MHDTHNPFNLWSFILDGIEYSTRSLNGRIKEVCRVIDTVLEW